MKKMSRVQRKIRRRKIFLTVLSIVIVGYLTLMFMFNSSWFSINDIKVTGNKKVLSNKIALFSSIQKGENIFKVSTKDAEKSIIELPYIKDVEVNRKLPKQIIINVSEREEKIKIKDRSSFIILDEEGYILDKRENVDINLSEIIGLNIQNKTVGDNSFVDNKDQTKVGFIIESEQLDMLKDFKFVNMEDVENINILTFNEIEVVFGSVNNVKYKLGLLNEVLKDIKKRDLQAKMILMDRGDNPVLVLEDEEEKEE